MKISKKLRTAVALSLVMGGVHLFGCSVANATDLSGSQSAPLDLSQYNNTELSTYDNIYLIDDTSNNIENKELKITGKDFTVASNLVGANAQKPVGNKLTIENSSIIAYQIAAATNAAGDEYTGEKNILELIGADLNVPRGSVAACYGRSDSDCNSNENEVVISGGTIINGYVFGVRLAGGKDNIITIKDDADLSKVHLSVVDGTSKGGNTITFENYSGDATNKKYIGSIQQADILNFNDSANIKIAGYGGKTGWIMLDKAFDAKATININLKNKLAEMILGEKLSIVETDGYIYTNSTTITYNLNGVAVANGDKKDIGTKTDNGVDVSNLTFNANYKEISVTANSKLLTGKFIDGSNPAVEKELVLDAKAANYENIYGAYSKSAASDLKSTVEMKNSVDLSKSTILGNNNGAAGNTLKVSAVDVKVGNIKNFENLSFVLPADINSGDKMLTVNSALDMKEVKGVDVDGSKATNIHKGGTVDLLTADSISNYNAEVTMDGTLVEKKATVAQEDNVLRLTVVEEKPKENENGVKISKAPVEAVAAGVAAINEGADLIAGGMMSSLAVADANSSADVFGAIGGSKGKYKTGSHVESNSWNIGLGLGKVNAKEKNTTTAGLFFEYGKSDFDTYNGSLKGDGKAFYRGAGILGRVDNHSGNYLEGSIRAGRASSEWSNSDAGRYDDSATYFGAHLGYGHKLQVGSAQKLDMYGKYFYSHLGSMEGKLKEADYQFDSVNTHRVRVGARMEYELKGQAKPYFGLAYEHTFNGDANATMRFGNQTDNPGTPSVQGNTGILEAGCKWTGNKVDWAAGVEGYTGVRKGISGNVNVNWKF